MRLRFYGPDDVADVWPDVAPLFEKVVEKAVHGEFTVDDLFRLAKAGRITVGLAREDDGGKTPVMAVAFEFRRYPSATAVNVLAMGGAIWRGS